MYTYKLWGLASNLETYEKTIKRRKLLTEKQQHEERERFCQQLISKYDFQIVLEGCNLVNNTIDENI